MLARNALRCSLSKLKFSDYFDGFAFCSPGLFELVSLDNTRSPIDRQHVQVSRQDAHKMQTHQREDAKNR